MASYLEHGNKMEIDSDSASVSSVPRKTRPARRKVSMATRRRSRLLYLEKYGLNQPDWHTGSHDDGNDDVSDEDSNMEKPIEYTEEPEEIITTKRITIQRPVSIRNYVECNTSPLRPNRFIKPIKSNSDTMSFPASEFKKVHDLMEKYTDKVYMEGYLEKRNDLNSNGNNCEIKKWSSWYVELCGPVLTLWDNSITTTNVYPQYINITDSTVKIENCLTVETRINLFSLNSAGANRFILQAPNKETLSKWILAIRLSCFECSHLQEIYTKSFITRQQFNPILNQSSLLKMEGFLQVRFPGSTGWKKFWSVVSNTRMEKKLFSKKLIQTNGQVLFFESKKSKHPFMTLKNVVQTYTIYPESTKLINIATIFKIEGSLYNKNQQLISDSSSALLMTSNTNEMVHWLIATFNSFQLYGKPSTLLQDSTLPSSLNFAENMDSSRLFLEPQEVNWVDIKKGLLENKKEFSNILVDKLLNGSRLKQERRSSVTKSVLSNNVPVQQTHLRTVTCASDVSETDQESESDSDSDESLFKIPKKKQGSIKFTKPITPNASKSSSEVSSSSSSSLKPPFYAAQKSTSTPQWPMYGSTGTIVTSEYLPAKNWETSSVEPRMMSDNNSGYFTKRDSMPQYASSMVTNDDDDDNTPIASSERLFTQHSLLEQAQHDRIAAKSMEKKLRATGQPLVQVPAKKSAPRNGLLSVISEKESKSQDLNRSRALMDEQLLMRERMMMEQRQHQIMMQQVQKNVLYALCTD